MHIGCPVVKNAYCSRSCSSPESLSILASSYYKPSERYLLFRWSLSRSISRDLFSNNIQALVMNNVFLFSIFIEKINFINK